MAFIAKTVKELRSMLETYDDDLPIAIFDGNEGEASNGILVHHDIMTHDTSWARYTGKVVLLTDPEG